MHLPKKKFLIIIFYISFILFLIEFLAYGIIKILNNKAVFYNQSQVKQSYEDYVKVRDTLLGWKNNNADDYGARKDKSSFSKSKTCVDMYGDSFTYGYEVEDIDAWPSKLSEKLRCRVRNYGVVGYGTDQAYLRYQKQSSKYSKIVVLNHLSEDILRNINQFNNLLYPNAEFALKPRFIIANNQLSLIQTISLSKLEFKEFLDTPQTFLKYDYFTPFGYSGVQIASFPYVYSVAKAFNHYHVKAIFNNKSRIEEFYEHKHKSQALQVTEMIMREFERSARANGLIPILTIIPTCRDFEHKKIYGYFPYKNLPKELNKYSFFFIDFGLEIIENGLNYKDLYFNCSSHMNKIGNQVLAEIFERKLKKIQLY